MSKTGCEYKNSNILDWVKVWEEYQKMEQEIHEHFIQFATASKVAEHMLHHILARVQARQ